jgi:hypothetical protein
VPSGVETYGLLNLPSNVRQVEIELMLAFNRRLFAATGWQGRFFHLKNAIDLIWNVPRRQHAAARGQAYDERKHDAYIWNEWSEETQKLFANTRPHHHRAERFLENDERGGLSSLRVLRFADEHDCRPDFNDAAGPAQAHLERDPALSSAGESGLRPCEREPITRSGSRKARMNRASSASRPGRTTAT